MNALARRWRTWARWTLPALIWLSIGPTVWAEPVEKGAATGRAARFIGRRHTEYAAHARKAVATPRGRARAMTIEAPAPHAAATTPLKDPDTGETLGYVISLDPVGYIVTSGDTDLAPVIAFSMTSNFSFEESPNNVLLKMMRADLKQRLAARANAPAEVLAANRTKWTALAADADGGEDEGGGAEPESSGTQIWGPWLDTRWSQGHPYNIHCPIDPNTGGRCVVGCVATMYGQIVNYWQYPRSVTFVSPGDDYISVMDPNDGKGTRVMDIVAETATIPAIDYGGDPDDPNHPTEDMIARLLYACGVSVHMGYSSVLSGPCGGGDFAGTWGYSSAGGLFEDNLKLGRVAACSIVPLVGEWGHAIVCDGYWVTDNPAGGNELYHLNFGWAGGSDGWYLPTALPGVWLWGGGGTVYTPPAPKIVLPEPNAVAYEGVPFVLGTPPEIDPNTQSLPVGWSFSDVAPVPDGVEIDPNTGVIQWDEPNLAGSPYALILLATNPAGESAPAIFQLDVVPAPPVIEAIPDAAILPGVGYTGPEPNLIQGSLPVTWSLVDNPAGMTIDPATGVVTWPSPVLAGSPHTVTIRATHATAGSDDETWQVTVMTEPSMDAIPDQTVCTNEAYVETPNVPASSLPVTWSLLTAPNGVTLDPNNGQVSWLTPTVTGSPHTFTLKAQNAVGTDQKTWEVSVQVAPVINGLANQTVSAGVPYSRTPTLAQGTEPITWTLVTGPTGMNINPTTGQVTWNNPVPTLDGSPYEVTVGAANDCNDGEVTWQLLVQEAPQIAEIPDGAAIAGAAYGETPTLLAGSLPVAWTLLSGPEGMTVDRDTGVVSWPDPGPAGMTVTVQIEVENAVDSDTESWDLTVIPPLGVPIIAAIDDAEIVAGQAYAGPTPVLTQGTLPVIWSLEQGPANMIIDDQTGVVSWANPTTQGSPHTIKIRATNGLGFGEQTWQLSVLPEAVAPEIAEMPDRTIVAGQAYGEMPELVQGTLPVAWSLEEGPTGMTVDPDTGEIAWPNPTTAGSPFTVRIQASNTAGPDEESYLLTVEPAVVAPVILGVGDVPTAYVGSPYTGPTPEVSGTQPITWTLALKPTGMTINASTGVVSWPSPVAGAAPRRVILRATNQAGSDEYEFQVTVETTPVAPDIAPIDDATIGVGQAYTGPTPGVTGTAPIEWTLVTHPVGMTVDADTGVVSWASPTSVGSPHLVTIRATNAAGDDEESWSLAVVDAPVIGAIPDAAATEGQAYTGPVPTLTQGGPNAAWSLIQGPTGMTIAANGVVSWPTPKVLGGPHTVKIRATTVAGVDDETWLVTVTRADVPPVINPIANGEVAVGQGYVGPTPSLAQGGSNVTWTLVSPASGADIDAGTGVVSIANPGNLGDQHAITIRATNTAGSDEVSWTVTVVQPLVTVTVGISPADLGLAMTIDGQNCTGVCSFQWRVGSTHQIQVASPQQGNDGSSYLFSSWSDGHGTASRSLSIVAGGLSGYTVTMQRVTATGVSIVGPSTVTENASVQYQLMLSMSDGGSAQVTSQGSWRLSSTQYAQISQGKVTAREVTSDTYCEIYASYTDSDGTLSARLPITITNAVVTYTLTVSTSPAGAGSPARSTHQAGQVVTVTAPDPPEAGMIFLGWGGSASGTDDVVYVNMDGNKDVVAYFAKPEDAAGFCGAPAAAAAALVGGLALLRSAGVGGRRRRRRRRPVG